MTTTSSKPTSAPHRPTGAAASSRPPRFDAPRQVLVWDLPVRLFHWLMVACFAGAWLTGESERWRLLHVTLGYTMGGLVAFRILWGLVGPRHARFASFVRGPGAVWAYLRSMWQRRPEHHVGHNPAGAMAIVALLALTLVVAGSGWAVYSDQGGDWLEDVHEAAAHLMLIVVLVHVAGVALGSWLHRENLVRSMITGMKLGQAADGAAGPWRSVGLLVLVAVLGFWWLQWRDAPVGAVGVEQAADVEGMAHRRASHGKDH